MLDMVLVSVAAVSPASAISSILVAALQLLDTHVPPFFAFMLSVLVVPVIDSAFTAFPQRLTPLVVSLTGLSPLRHRTSSSNSPWTN